MCDVATSPALDIPARPGGVGGSVCSTPLLLGFTLVLLIRRLGKDFPSSLAFGMILVFNFASLPHGCFRASPGIVSIYLWWCDFFRMGCWQRLLHPQTQTFITDVLKEQQQCLSLARSPLDLKMPSLGYFPLPSCSKFHPHQLDDDLCSGQLHQTGMLETRRWGFPGILLPNI